MNIPPFLEKLLLSNEAVFKNASLGLSGQNFIPVPKGKTAVILEINIQAFCNTGSMFFEGSSYEYIDWYNEIVQRKMWQLQIINDLYNSYYSFQNNFSITPFYNSTSQAVYASAQIQFTGFKEDVFIYTDRGLYFNIIYPFQPENSSGISVSYAQPNGNFLPIEQNLPPKNTTFYKSNFIEWVAGILANGSTEVYAPTNRNTATPFLLPLKEYFRLDAENTVNPSPLTSIKQPINTGDTYSYKDLFTLPLINIKYALLNKRPSDYGLTLPTK